MLSEITSPLVSLPWAPWLAQSPAFLNGRRSRPRPGPRCCLADRRGRSPCYGVWPPRQDQPRPRSPRPPPSRRPTRPTTTHPGTSLGSFRNDCPMPSLTGVLGAVEPGIPGSARTRPPAARDRPWSVWLRPQQGRPSECLRRPLQAEGALRGRTSGDTKLLGSDPKSSGAAPTAPVAREFALVDVRQKRANRFDRGPRRPSP
jgi:hypothetical protein